MPIPLIAWAVAAAAVAVGTAVVAAVTSDDSTDDSEARAEAERQAREARRCERQREARARLEAFLQQQRLELEPAEIAAVLQDCGRNAEPGDDDPLLSRFRQSPELRRQRQAMAEADRRLDLNARAALFLKQISS